MPMSTSGQPALPVPAGVPPMGASAARSHDGVVPALYGVALALATQARTLPSDAGHWPLVIA